MDICAVIPCFNAEKTIGDIVFKIKRQDIDVIVIDDGSEDSTAEAALKNGGILLKNNSNRGKGASLRKGFDYAVSKGYGAVIALDGDGQHLPEDIPGFISAYKANPQAAMIIGNRMDRPKGMPYLRKITNKIMSGVMSFLARQYIPDSQNGFRLIKGSLLKKIELKSNRFEIESEMILKAANQGLKIISMPISTVYKDNPSFINPLVDTCRFIRFILPFLKNAKL